MSDPAIQEPRRAGEFGRNVGPCDWGSVDFSQNRIGESSGRALGCLDELYRLVNNGMRRETLQVAELENSGSEGLPHFEVKLADRLSRVALDQIIQLRTKPQRPEYNLTC